MLSRVLLAFYASVPVRRPNEESAEIDSPIRAGGRSVAPRLTRIQFACNVSVATNLASSERGHECESPIGLTSLLN